MKKITNAFDAELMIATKIHEINKQKNTILGKPKINKQTTMRATMFAEVIKRFKKSANTEMAIIIKAL